MSLTNPLLILDMFSVEALKELMRKLKQAGHTIVVAEHRLYYLTDLADRFLYMENGRLQKEWSAMELLQLSELETQKHRDSHCGFAKNRNYPSSASKENRNYLC